MVRCIHHQAHVNLLRTDFISHTGESKELILRRAKGAEDELIFYNQIMSKHFGLHSSNSWYLQLLAGTVGQTSQISYESKPRRIYILKDTNQEIYGMFICALKRSNILKIFPLLITNSVQSLDFTIKQLEDIEVFRKIFFFIPIFYEALYEILRQRDYLVEGMLRDPYSPGNDILVLSKTNVGN